MFQRDAPSGSPSKACAREAHRETSCEVALMSPVDLLPKLPETDPLKIVKIAQRYIDAEKHDKTSEMNERIAPLMRESSKRTLLISDGHT